MRRAEARRPPRGTSTRVGFRLTTLLSTIKPRLGRHNCTRSQLPTRPQGDADVEDIASTAQTAVSGGVWTVGVSVAWCSRFGDIPGISYTTPPWIDRSRLPGANTRPKVQRFQDGEGKPFESLSWTGREGSESVSTSQAPARQHADASSSGDADQLLRRLAEVLELPGKPSDYHFAIQNAVDALWTMSSENPTVLNDIERLVWDDIALAQAVPDAVSTVLDGVRQWYRITGLARLVGMYEREGAWREALEVTRIAATSFDQLSDKLEELTERVAALESETP